MAKDRMAGSRSGFNCLSSETVGGGARWIPGLSTLNRLREHCVAFGCDVRVSKATAGSGFVLGDDLRPE